MLILTAVTRTPTSYREVPSRYFLALSTSSCSTSATACGQKAWVAEAVCWPAAVRGSSGGVRRTRRQPAEGRDDRIAHAFDGVAEALDENCPGKGPTA